MFSFITGKTKKIGLRMLPSVADFTSAHLKLRCLIVLRLHCDCVDEVQADITRPVTWLLMVAVGLTSSSTML